MKRGEVWIGSGGAAYAGKPRPMLIVQSDRVAGFASVIICPLTVSREAEGDLRPHLPPSEITGLKLPSWLMIDKLSAIPRTKLDKRIGQLTSDEMAVVSAAMTDLLGLDA